MARSSILSSRRERVIVRQSYYWPDWQLNFWIIIMLTTAGVLIGINTNFLLIQNRLDHLGIPWIIPFGLTVGSLLAIFILLMLTLIVQRRLLPGVLILGSFILLVLFITGLIETAIQLFGEGNINSICNTFVMGQPSNDRSVDTLAWLQQNSICQSWSAVFAFWIIGVVFLIWLIVIAAMVARGGFGDDRSRA